MSLSLNGVPLDDPRNVFVIAELSGNHGQSYAQAERLVAAAAEAGANAVKVQTFTAESICADVPILTGHDAAHDAWIERQGVTRLRELMAKGGFPRKWHKKLKRFAEKQGVQFLSTPFSVDDARFLVDDVGVDALKIASGDMTYQPLTDYAARTGLPILLSTGMATEDEVYAVATSGPMWRTLSGGRLVILHCVSAYPCPEEAVNLHAITAMQQRFRQFMHITPFQPLWGWSDHTLDSHLVAPLAVALGCTIVEKHIRLETDNVSIDAQHSLPPRQFKIMVDNIRCASRILGEQKKAPHALEAHELLWARRGSDGLRPTDEAREGRWA